jgi:23S rRNA (guanine745-N1)-methyltransferase
MLGCPHCGARLEEVDGTLRCERAHSFDLARSGYVSLLAAEANTSTADSSEMVAARERFLAAGRFAALVEAITDAARGGVANRADRTLRLVEVGAGTGFYLRNVLDVLPGAVGLALDASKHACRRAARAHPRMGAVVCDVWAGIPVLDGSVDLVLDVFAPRNAAEFERVLRPDGALILVTPTPRHLAELVEPLGLVRVDPDKALRVDRAFTPHFVRGSSVLVEECLTLDRENLIDAVAMGPSARHLTEVEIAERVEAMTLPRGVALSVEVSVYRRR